MRSCLLAAIPLLVALLPATAVEAHEVRPAYLELRETAEGSYDVLWKVPAAGSGLRFGVEVRFPEAAVESRESEDFPGGRFVGASYVERWSLRQPGGLTDETIHFEGLRGTLTDVLVRVQHFDGTTQVTKVSPSSPSVVVEASPTRWQVAGTYLGIGTMHILGGVDHLLFVLCLVLVAGTGRRVLITVTGFTIAHSITLTLSALQMVRLPVPPVEATIALSIVFLASEIARGRKESLTYRYPITVSSSFGLLHGFGFASALREVGLPETEIVTSLLFFNVGVELGQILFIGCLLAGLWLVRLQFRIASRGEGPGPLHAARLEKPAAYLVGSLASFWLIQRVAGFWP